MFVYHSLCREVLERAGASGPAERRAELGITEHATQALRQRRNIARREL